MKPRGAGVVIQTGSALAYRGIPGQAAYCGAKHAVVGFTESVITELRHERSAVRVAMVHLPAMNTPQFNWVLSRLSEHPQPVVYLAAHPRSRMWVGESTFGTILGNRVAAGLLDRYLARTGYDGQQTDAAPRPEIGDNLCTRSRATRVPTGTSTTGRSATVRSPGSRCTARRRSVPLARPWRLLRAS